MRTFAPITIGLALAVSALAQRPTSLGRVNRLPVTGPHLAADHGPVGPRDEELEQRELKDIFVREYLEARKSKAGKVKSGKSGSSGLGKTLSNLLPSVIGAVGTLGASALNAHAATQQANALAAAQQPVYQQVAPAVAQPVVQRDDELELRELEDMVVREYLEARSSKAGKVKSGKSGSGGLGKTLTKLLPSVVGAVGTLGASAINAHAATQQANALAAAQQPIPQQVAPVAVQKRGWDEYLVGRELDMEFARSELSDLD
ncbi:hypothetical protein EIP91_011896 [Steccherinum ochraceum]|uniref:Uncharacterized protein n=1 Tax=Steccherinum ochraceum TaxID=92696 RepID=A0A4R0RXR8_9APHY|nr:hypothetical protein EIP91_011896 [Steccherinum ochraceum]